MSEIIFGVGVAIHRVPQTISPIPLIFSFVSRRQLERAKLLPIFWSWFGRFRYAFLAHVRYFRGSVT